MRSRLLFELSQELALLLERGLAEDAGKGRLPVFLCHPLDAVEAAGDGDRGAVAILYLSRVGPERATAPGGFALVPPARGDRRERLRWPDLLVRARFVFLVSGGTVEEQLGAITRALQTLHDHPAVTLPAGSEDGSEASGEAPEAVVCPLRLVDDPDGWSGLGLPEHRLTVTFEVTLPIPTQRAETVGRTRERELLVTEDVPEEDVLLEDGAPWPSS